MFVEKFDDTFGVPGFLVRDWGLVLILEEKFDGRKARNLIAAGDITIGRSIGIEMSYPTFRVCFENLGSLIPRNE